MQTTRLCFIHYRNTPYTPTTRSVFAANGSAAISDDPIIPITVREFLYPPVRGTCVYKNKVSKLPLQDALPHWD